MPEKSLPPGLTPANSVLGNCVMPAPRLLGSMTSIALLLRRSAKKYLLSLKFNQRMSNEKNVPAVFRS